MKNFFRDLVSNKSKNNNNDHLIEANDNSHFRNNHFVQYAQPNSPNSQSRKKGGAPGLDRLHELLAKDENLNLTNENGDLQNNSYHHQNSEQSANQEQEVSVEEKAKKARLITTIVSVIIALVSMVMLIALPTFLTGLFVTLAILGTSVTVFSLVFPSYFEKLAERAIESLSKNPQNKEEMQQVENSQSIPSVSNSNILSKSGQNNNENEKSDLEITSMLLEDKKINNKSSENAPSGSDLLIKNVKSFVNNLFHR